MSTNMHTIIAFSAALLSGSLLALIVPCIRRKAIEVVKAATSRVTVVWFFFPLRLQTNKRGSLGPVPRDVFPPSRRDALLSVLSVAATRSRIFPSRVATLIENQNLALAPTPTGLDREEIKALGDFPDYERLSGVRLPKAHTAFDIATSKCRPYRPFRWPYHQTMSLMKMDADFWIELDDTYASRIKERQELHAVHGQSILDSLSGSELACKELMEMCIQFLCNRYPQHFSLDESKEILHNRILGLKTDLRTINPLNVLLGNIPEDFAVMLRNPDDGLYYFRAGIICSSIGWTLGTKLGLRLSEIHAPVPYFKDKMEFSMDRFFSRLPTDKPIQRGSWGIEIGEPLYMPPGDPRDLRHKIQDENVSAAQLNLRVDWQTLRRLPVSGAVVFNFKALFTPINDFRNEPFIPSIVLKIFTEGKASLLESKNAWHVEHIVVPTMAAFEKEQKDEGLIPRYWETCTLDESPFYPGWKSNGAL